MNKLFNQITLFIFLCCFSLISYAWNNSIEFGYGESHDPNHSQYNNSGFLLSGDIWPLYHARWAFLSITGSLAQLRTSAPNNKNVTGGAASLALRLYPLTVEQAYPFYLLGSAGPAIISSRKFGENRQAYNLTIQSNLGLGMEFCPFDINLRLEHFSNAGIKEPNDGFNVLYLLSVGYLF